MFSFFRKKTPADTAATPPAPDPAGAKAPATAPVVAPAVASAVAATAATGDAGRAGWLSRLRQGLARTGASVSQVFTGTRIDDALYEELESVLLMADAGTAATTALLADLKRRVKDARATEPAVAARVLG